MRMTARNTLRKKWLSVTDGHVHFFSLTARSLLLTSLVGIPVHAAEIRGTLQGIENLQPTPPPPVQGRRAFYWEEPNGAIDVRRPHAVTDMDIAVILTGDQVAEARQPVSLPVIGGRCRPGTVVVTPNTVLRLQNQDWMAHEFFATAPGHTEPIRSFGPEMTAPRSERQVQIPQPGTYEIRDRLQPAFRCWVVVGPGQGRAITPAPDGTFRFASVTDGNYTLNVYYEGRAIAETTTQVTNDRNVTLPPLMVNATGTAPSSRQDNSATSATPSTDAGQGNHQARRRRGH